MSAQSLRSKRVRRLFRGVYIGIDVVLTDEIWVRAASLALPFDAALSHTSNLHRRGVAVGKKWPLQFSTNSALRCRIPGIELHRRKGRLHPDVIEGIAVLGPDRTFVDSATQLSLVELIRAGDWLIRLDFTTLEKLTDFAMRSHLDGVRKARRALAYVRERVESPWETDVRLMLQFARLPVPEVNVDILDEDGRFIARGDLVYRRFRILVEYDGWQHERDARQRQRDRERRELLEAAGWRLIIITSEDFKRPLEIARRVHRALLARGYVGPSPVFSIVWRQWFAN